VGDFLSCGLATRAFASLRSDASGVLGRVEHANARVVIRKKGLATAALVSIPDLELFEALEDWTDILLARTALADSRAKEGKPIPWSDVKEGAGR
jgi:hypothetical protein